MFETMWTGACVYTRTSEISRRSQQIHLQSRN